VYVLQARYIWKEEKIGPWDWDIDYPEDMFGKWFVEDVNALVQIDIAIDKLERDKREKK
jgi:hypothetical protein